MLMLMNILFCLVVEALKRGIWGKIDVVQSSQDFVMEQIYSMHLRCRAILVENVVVIVLIKHLRCRRQAISNEIKLVTANSRE